ncbi:MAG: DNA-3-methyladenine glycosylase I [Clostridiales bacterium]
MYNHRCSWVDLTSDLYIDYHDREWGNPSHDDRHLFEMLILEGAQAGLSWITILKKRLNYKKAFDNFDYNKISKYNSSKVSELLLNEGIIRNKLKINSAIKNANVFIKIQNEYKSFNNYIWQFVNNQPIINSFEKSSSVPVNTSISDKISKDLKKRGMSFVGSTIMYSFMQAVGMVNDHTTDCFRYKDLL